jgi:hypothetical protein
LFPPRAPSAGMHRASRPTPSPGNHGPAAPTTPHRVGAPDHINETIRSLNDAWKLGLQVRGPHWSPSTAVLDSKAEKICGAIKRLHYGDPDALYESIKGFGQMAPRLSKEKRLDLLLALLPASTSLTKTPKSSMQEATTQSPRTGLAQSYFPLQLCKYIILD